MKGEPRWFKTVTVVSDDGTKKREQVPSANYGVGKKWRARYVDEHAKGFDRKTDAQSWLNAQMSTLVQGTHVSPRDAQLNRSPDGQAEAVCSYAATGLGDP
ncbi:hypothetical protein [Nocardia asteroides]|uniref:Uncharacterized protein n=1 Tax=Nocardia asteroides NBRC 15531 TaxID=1110697 RepID=U5EM54_NOCAS|nr:hypothetical protein [Nocardia asteroides]UGT46839.1 hypothetical protein LT345_20140 [Nocardia asteroides]GAD87471.1 hypothetical protein NCAST_34_06010 [Nocardia asteroides NBRC 15531]